MSGRAARSDTLRSRSYARVDRRLQQVGPQVEQHHQRPGEDREGFDERVVALFDGLEQKCAETRYLEDLLQDTVPPIKKPTLTASTVTVGMTALRNT